MKITIATDHAGYDYKKELINWLKEKGYNVVDYGAFDTKSSDYPDFAYPAAEAVAKHEADIGIVFCGSGIGMSIVCNKVKGVRSALCWNKETAALARQHNNANIINFGARFIDIDTAKEMIEIFIKTGFEGGRHDKRVEKIHSLSGK